MRVEVAPARRQAAQTVVLLLALLFLLAQTRLPYAEVQARRTAGRLGFRVGGTGLPGYHTGYFTLQGDEVRSVSAAASNRDGGVLVQASGKTFFLTPADPEGVLRELAARGAKVVA